MLGSTLIVILKLKPTLNAASVLQLSDCRKYEIKELFYEKVLSICFFLEVSTTYLLYVSY